MKKISTNGGENLPKEDGEYFVWFNNGNKASFYFFSKEINNVDTWRISVAHWLDESEERVSEAAMEIAVNFRERILSGHPFSTLSGASKIEAYAKSVAVEFAEYTREAPGNMWCLAGGEVISTSDYFDRFISERGGKG